MYMDGVVIAGVGTVLLMVGFMVAVGWFVVHDAKTRGNDKHKQDGR
ncbi:cytochrome c oxidase subunit CcoM [Marinobacter zhanjiangensis]|uniref:DUF3149 domain-containing protein n=1 Tax=Marinobacter zhanjiangensis TaxID=578215 RepID=A0ABQ3AX05_9GAMM|nr:cytochrome c oxidase subunit CcoM [Marinobacter zhanjiangensis]GGY66554.1 hypothetical protein GCM10007071_11750 [Marinobacter zhanjiangensis]